ncbi:hypothetical protein ACFQU1_00290 [Chelatococcus sp. GCM10030263]|uniref:hypothetical protein n=1 Tax=Chelatococcus sp. GCM10030263 TaxID=3273387 RepID=UPI003619D01E
MDMRQEPFSSDEPNDRSAGEGREIEGRAAPTSEGRQLVPVAVAPRIDPDARPSINGAAMSGGLATSLAELGARLAAFSKRHGAVLAAAMVLILGSAGSFAIAKLSESQPGSGGHAGSATSDASVVAAKSPPIVGTEQRQADIARLSDELRKMKAGLDSLRASVDASRNTDDLKALRTTVAALKDDLARTKQDTSGAVAQATAQLSKQIDKLDHVDNSAKLAQITARLERIEKQMADQTVTGSIKPAAPPPKPTPRPLAKIQPKTVPGWSVREVYDGAALLEGRGGLFEVSPGANVPGLGRIQSIERRNGGWVVVTAAGLVQSEW